MTKKDDSASEIDLVKKLEEAKKAAEVSDSKEKEAAANKSNTEMDSLSEELTQMTELAKRTMADLQNIKRRQEEEKSIWIKMANAELIKALLPILDNLDRAITHLPQSSDSTTQEWFKGVEMSINLLHQAMKDAGLEPLECLGQPFDPDSHEAMAQGPGENNIIIEEFEKGYRLGDKVIRHAKVKVGNGEKA